MMLISHALVKSDGIVHSLYGRPRRIPAAKNIGDIYGHGTLHAELPYEARNMLNLAMNHRVQSSAASIVNRAMIAFYKEIRRHNLIHCCIVSQIHDEIIVECYTKDGPQVAGILQYCMEETTTLPGVKLLAKPVIAYNMADLKE
jgi:DNA polymerase I-like protein with 3'-5' exonuclease and polymerase domains